MSEGRAWDEVVIAGIRNGYPLTMSELDWWEHLLDLGLSDQLCAVGLADYRRWRDRMWAEALTRGLVRS